jgi:hypothetical protein
VRSALIIFGAGACVSLLMPQMPAYQLLSSAPAWSAVLLLLVAVAIGVIADARAWFVAACSYLLGVAVWVVAWLRPSPPWTPSDNWFLATWLQFLLANVLLPMLIFAAMAMAAHAIVRVVTRRREHHAV